ncbi:MAG: hypothetical protein K2G37_02140, partial [Clostridia bacterium]|nr:hypothetical protein [Clostridia bacterium]
MRKLFICLILVVAIIGVFAFSACSNGYIAIEYDPTTTYGVYWYADGDYVRSSEGMSTDLFDPNKPTFIFAHGWEPDANNTSNGLVEDLITHADTVSKTGASVVNYAELLKEQGYNVALLGWFSYASDLTKLFRCIWVDFDDGNALSVRFAQELAAVMGEDYSKDIKLVGHSYGSQLAIATVYQLTKFKENGIINNSHLIPTRITLADPYLGLPALIEGWNGTISKAKISYTNEKINARAPKTLFADVVDYIVQTNDTAVDIYMGMGVASTMYYRYDGSDADFEKLSSNCSIVKSAGLISKYGDTNVHNITRDWTLVSIVESITLYDQNGDIAPSGAATDAVIKSLRGKCYNQDYKGFNVAADSMTLVDR